MLEISKEALRFKRPRYQQRLTEPFKVFPTSHQRKSRKLAEKKGRIPGAALLIQKIYTQESKSCRQK